MNTVLIVLGVLLIGASVAVIPVLARHRDRVPEKVEFAVPVACAFLGLFVVLANLP